MGTDAPQVQWLEVPERRGGRAYHRTKRALDIVLSLSLLVLASPLMLLIAALVMLDSPGGAFFVQERMGYDRRRCALRTFRVIKYRTMSDHCDESVHRDYVRAWARGELAEDGERFKLASDARVTRVGRVLRKTSLDELPQFWNVLRGEMSLVGPRPVPLYEVAEYEPWHYQRLLATPGLTGLWQVKARAQCALDEMARLDIEYIGRQSLWLDLTIMALTIPAILSGRGAG
jgi:lipopolysaccharide/colanic/teichoic acid biosynthesis glycosyltransferase